MYTFSVSGATNAFTEASVPTPDQQSQPNQRSQPDQHSQHNPSGQSMQAMPPKATNSVPR